MLYKNQKLNTIRRKNEMLAQRLMEENMAYGPRMTRLLMPTPAPITQIWRSREFLAQVFEKANGVQRISINRAAIDVDNGRWVDGISWDDIQRIKAEMGFGGQDAVEIYPPDRDKVDVANMRHLWILDDPLPYAWRKP
jgi:hypothetical protein